MNRPISSDLQTSIAELSALLPKLQALEPQLQQFADALWTCWEAGGKAMVAGNGGSSADAMHLAEELVVRFHKNRKALAAMALCDPTVLTCVSNDFGYEQVFARQVEAFARPGDVFVGLSTSGNSVNLVNALELCRERQVATVGLLGRDGGKMLPLCDIALVVPNGNTARIQEAHKLLFHTVCMWIDDMCG